MSVCKYVLIASCLVLVNPALAQTFTVSSRVGGDQLVLDDTLQVTFTVQMTGASSTLSNVLPSLAPPACSVINVSGKDISIFSTSYVGYKNGATTVEAAVPSWTSGTSKELVFNVHLYDNVMGGQSICTNLCTGQIEFIIGFTWQGQSTTVLGGSSNNLRFLRPDENVVNIVERASHMAIPLPNGGLIAHSDEFPWPLAGVNPLQTNLTNPDTKIYLALDWYTFGFSPTSMFDFFIYPFSRTCSINHLHISTGQVQLYNGTLVDTTGLVAGTTNGVVPLAPPGGAGNVGAPDGSGWNFYDLSSFNPTCGSVRTAIDYSNPPYSIIFDLFRTAVIREVALFIGVQGSCQPLTFAFGPPSPEFEITEFHTDSRGNIRATANAPTLWKTGADLSSSYAIDWYARTNQSITKLTDINSDGVKLTLDVDAAFAITDDLVIEARVRHIASNDSVSTISAVNGFSYALGGFGFLNAETPIADSFLDPGETLVLPYQVTNESGDTAFSVSVEVGVDPAVSTEAFPQNSAIPATLTDTQQVVSNLSYELFAAPACDQSFFYVEVSHVRGSLTTSYREYFSVGTNCENTNVTEFRSLSNWTPAPSAKAGVSGWTYNNGWFGEADNASQLYTLQSPVVRTGAFPSFDLTHLPNLPLNLAGGVLEYSVSPNGSTSWSSWQDLVLQIETFEAIQIYHSLVFPNTISSSIANRRVWMHLNPPVSPLILSGEQINPNLINPLVDKYIRFRFAFQAPYLDQNRSTSPSWEISDFTFKSQQPFFDNVLGALDLTFFSCETWAVELSVADSYSAEWYESLGDLYAGTPSYTTQSVNNVVTWDLSIPNLTVDTTIYLRVVSDTTGIARIFPVSITVPQGGVPSLASMLDDWREDDEPLSDLNADLIVDILDYVFRENEDVCSQ